MSSSARVWFGQGWRQLRAARLTTLLMTACTALSAVFLCSMMVAWLMVSAHVPPGAGQAGRFLTVGRAAEGVRHGLVDLDTYEKLRRAQPEGGQYFAANAGSRFRLAKGAVAVDARAGFASDGFLPALGVALGKGAWPGPRQVLLSSDMAVRLYGDAGQAIGRMVKLGEADMEVSGVIAPGFPGLRPAWDGGAPLDVWADVHDLFAVSGFDHVLPADIRGRIELFSIYFKDAGGAKGPAAVTTHANHVLRSGTQRAETWQAVPGIFASLAEHDALDDVLEPMSIALVGTLLAILIALVAHEARTAERRAGSVRLRRQLGAPWSRLAWQEALTSLPLAGILAGAALLAIAAFMVRAQQMSGFFQVSEVVNSALAYFILPCAFAAALPPLSRLLLLVALALRGEGNTAPRRLGAWLLGAALVLGLPAASILMTLAQQSTRILAEVGPVVSDVHYVTSGRPYPERASADRRAMEALAMALQRLGINADVATSAPFATCEHVLEVRPEASADSTFVGGALIGIGQASMDVLGVRIVEGAPAQAGEVLVSQSLARTFGKAAVVGTVLVSRERKRFRISGVAADQLFDAPSADNPMKIYMPGASTGCPWFIVLRRGNTGQMQAARNAYDAAFGGPRVIERVAAAKQAMFALVMLAQAVVLGCLAVLAVVAYLLCEAVLGFLQAQAKAFAIMKSVGAARGDLFLQAMGRCVRPLTLGVLGAASIAAALWWLLDLRSALDAAVYVHQLVVAALAALLVTAAVVAVWTARMSEAQMSARLKGEQG